MSALNRRRFLQLSGASLAAATAEMLGGSIARAAEIPAHRATGTIKDVEHVVVLMQENRPFDHYFGTLKGVRGFSDPHPALLPSGKDVWHQNNGSREVLPYHPDAPDLGMQYLKDLDHGWSSTQAAFNKGRYDRWLSAKSTTTMAHYERQDIPFHFALADAFTICDAYHCSLLGPTDPNRYYLFSGWDGNDGTGGGPDLWNKESGYSWSTYPEALQEAGVSWKVYQDAGDGLDAAGSWGWTSDAHIGNYGDNSLLYFKQYQNAKPGEPLYENARTGTDAKHGDDLFRIFRQDVASGKLPQVSYITAPEAYSEHSNWPPNFGAWYVANILDILTSNAEVWSKTALFIMYDENDGFFDHVVPPHVNSPLVPGASTVSTANEFYTGAHDVPGGYGLGARVPMIVASPWSMGGWVCSETFDHTSVIRFMEERFGVKSPNISPWRRAVCGDLTSAFNFSAPSAAGVNLPGTSAYKPADHARHPDYNPAPPAVNSMPRQEPGTKPSRPLGYELEVDVRLADETLSARWANTGSLGAHVQVRSNSLPAAPYSYTVGAGASLAADWALGAEYDVQMHGPDGWYRRYAGTTAAGDVRISVARDGRAGHARFRLKNAGRAAVPLRLASAYGQGAQQVDLQPGQEKTVVLRTAAGWYDLTVTSGTDPKLVRVLAGRMRGGAPGTSDPQLGR